MEKKLELDHLPISLLGRFIYHCVPFRKKIMQQNIDIVFKQTISQHQKIILMKAFYSHAATSIREVILLGFAGSRRLKKRVKLIGIEYYLAATREKKGVLLLTGHLGNWEFSYIIALTLPHAQQLYGKFCVIRRPIKNKWLEKIIIKHCEDSGLLIINKQGARNKIAPVLKEGYGMFFALDQHASIKENVGINVDFFGKKAGTYIGLATHAQKGQIPVVPLSSYRLNDGTHVVEFHPQLQWQDYHSTEQAIYENTRIYNQKLEQMILAHPEQWLWVHRRWKLLDAVDTSFPPVAEIHQ